MEKIIYRLVTTIGLTFAAALFPGIASAGCGIPIRGHALPAIAAATTSQQASAGDADTNVPQDPNDPIAGMWKVTFTATDNSGYTDFGYSQWHADGTEFLNSGSRAPDTQNFCLGVWKKTVLSTYRLNHFALSYDGSTGALTNKVNISEEVKLGPDNNTFAGVFAILLYDPTGTTMVGQITGKITASRVTIDTVLP